MKAAHYDPNKNGVGQGGWWVNSNRSDSPLAYGPPGQRVRATGASSVPDPNGLLAQANAGWTGDSFPGFDPFSVSLGAYPDVQSPWGLLDTAGATTEWTEETYSIFDPPTVPQFRIFTGSYWASSLGNTSLDRVGVFGAEVPSFALGTFGLRIASSVPVPSSGMVCLGCVLLLARRERCARLRCATLKL